MTQIRPTSPVRSLAPVKTPVAASALTAGAVRVAEETQGPNPIAKALAAVRDEGDYVGVMPPAVPPAERGVRTSAVSVRADGERLSELLARSAAGELEIRVAGTGPLQEAAAIYAKVAGGGQRGRWVLEV